MCSFDSVYDWKYKKYANHQPLSSKEKTKVSQFFVNSSYHFRHHYDDVNCYYSGMNNLFDRVLGSAISLKRKTVAITGGCGAMGRALCRQLTKEGANVILLTSRKVKEEDEVHEQVVFWEIGKENDLKETLKKLIF